MAKLDTNIVVLGVSALYVLFFFPTGLMLLTYAFAVGVFVLQNSIVSAAGVFIFMIALRMLSSLLTPTVVSAPKASGREGFQAKDPISIHQRIAAVKAAAPPATGMAPGELTGVLETSRILDTMQIADIAPEEAGAALAPAPAPLKAAATRIRTPDEGFVPAQPSPDAAPKPTPYLQAGPDKDAETTALAPSGASLTVAQPAGDVSSTTTGPATV